MKSGHLLLLNNILDLIESLEPTVYLPFYTDALHRLLGIFLTIISVRVIVLLINKMELLTFNQPRFLKTCISIAIKFLILVSFVLHHYFYFIE